MGVPFKYVRPVHPLVVQSAVRDDTPSSASATCFAATSTRQLLVALSTMYVDCTGCAERKELIDLLLRTRGGTQAAMDVASQRSRDVDASPRQSMHETLEGWWAQQRDQQRPHGPHHSTANQNVANRDAAYQWLQKANDASDSASAVRYCQKSLALCETKEARTLLTHYNDAERVLGMTGILNRELTGRILQLQPDQTSPFDGNQSVIKGAWKRLALQLHPDRNRALNARAAMMRLTAAYQALTSLNAAYPYEDLT